MGFTKISLWRWIFVCVTYLFQFGNPQATCGFTTTLDDFNVHEITSPGHPNTYPQDTICRWQIDVKKYQQNKTLSLDFVTVDIEDSTNCTSEYINISTNTGHELGMLCGQQQMVYNFFIDSVVIVFKTGPSRVETRQGFKLVYQVLDESPCTETFTVNGRGQITNDTGFPSLHRCTYKLKHSSPDGIIRLYIEDLTSWTDSDCTRKYVLVYEGDKEDGLLLEKYCGGYPLRLFNFNFLVVIVSWVNPLDVYISYEEVACHYTRDVSTEEASIVRFRGPSDIHTCVWTAYPLLATHMIIITLTNVSIDCSNSRITIYNVQNRWSYCGNEDRIYMTTFGKVVVASIGLKTGSKRTSFDMRLKLGLVADCGAKRTIEGADEFVRTFQSPLHPGHYPSDLNCVWELRAPYINDTININVTQIDLGAGCKDVINIYNGAVYNFSSTTPDFIICGANNTNRTSYTSKIGVVTVLFVTDGPIGGTGFKMYYASPYKDLVNRPRPPAPSNAGLIVGIVFAVVIVVFIIGLVAACVVWYMRKKRRAANLPNIPVHVFKGPSDPSGPKLIERSSTLEGTPNPGYNSSVNTNSSTEDQTAGASTSSLPPSYSASMLNDAAVTI